MKKLSKKQIKHLRQLSEIAYEKELSFYLDNLRNRFDEWKSGNIDVWALSDIIHEFHDGKSRDLYKFYVSGDDYALHVAHAVKNNFVMFDEIEESCREHVQHLLNNFFLDTPKE
ncbi:MAG: hypothetical protein JXX14_17925 [Deltaproteobacteria bacterium]|nr:hypothetical protein [Deltaproteobacteria bacterium]